jgi:hypothetical protein
MRGKQMNNRSSKIIVSSHDRTTLVSKPGAAIEVHRINLTETERQKLSTGGAQIPAPVLERKKAV